MRILGIAVTVGTIALATGCDNSSTTAPPPADSGNGASDAAVADSGESDAGSCVLPSCLADLATSSCTPSGTCSQSQDADSNTYTCYQNGVARSDVIDLAGVYTTLTVRSSSATCYSMSYVLTDITSQIDTYVQVANGSGLAAATLSYELGAGGVSTWSVLCAGSQQPVTLDPACGNAWPAAWLSGPPLDCTGTAGCSM